MSTQTTAVPRSGAQDKRADALALLRRSELAAATELVREELGTADGEDWLTTVIVQAMQEEDLTFAGRVAAVAATLRHGGVLEPGDGPEPPHRAARVLSAGKLRHDAEQLRYLADLGVLDGRGLAEQYERIAAELDIDGPETRRPTTGPSAYGRLVHFRQSPRLDRALSTAWDPSEVEQRYLDHRYGIVVIDDFLVPEALAELRRFCLESTVWNANRYPLGRLGAFFDAGFNSPLLLQIAEELPRAFPRVIGRRHRLRQLWGFKYPTSLPADSTIHADFAAVNVNFWITPESANRDADSGGLVIYETDAPREWDFTMYNERIDVIRDYLRRGNAKAVQVPYRQNRAIIFNSDLFHATDAVAFAPEYENRRINITMLYGVREQDSLHPAPSATGQHPAWRSRALTRRRP